MALVTPDEPGRARVVAAIEELRRKLAAGEDTGSLTIPDPPRWRRLHRWFYHRVLGRWTPEEIERHRRSGHEMWLQMQPYIDDGSEPSS